MGNPTIIPTAKQHIAWNALKDKTIKYIGFGGGARGGKAQPLNSLVLTEKGFVKMGDLKVGDKVSTPNNGLKEIIAIHPQGIKKVYEIIFEDGVKTKVTDEHLWDCWKSKRGQTSRGIRKTKDLEATKFRIPLAEKVLFGYKYTGISPYLIGVLLGDGGLTKNNIVVTTADKEIIDNVKDELGLRYTINKKNDCCYTITCRLHDKKGFLFNPLLDELRQLGLMGKKSEDKFVPIVFRSSDYFTRLELLRGLMDTDGTVDKNGRCSFTTKSHQLALDTQYLIRSIGGSSVINKRLKYCDYKGIRKYCECYDISANHINKRLFFKLTRKKRRCKKPILKGRTISKINYIGKEECQCITINDKEGLYFTDDFILTHNSWLGAEWLVTNCYMYPGTKWFIGRNELARLMKSSYITFEKVCQHHGIPNSDWKLNGQYNYIKFLGSKSRIDLLDLKYQPSDPLYERFGSLEYTGGWIEEAGEIDFMAFDVLKSRIGQQKNEEYGLWPAKMLITFNPKKNWLYQLFYKPWRDKELPPEYAFIQALYGDNPHVADTYGKELEQIKDKATKQRLMFGNWDYEDDAHSLFKYDSLVDVFSNTISKSGQKFLLVDIADDGSDKTVFSFWEDLEEYRREAYDRLNTEGIISRIREYAGQERIPYSHIAVDAIGVGAGVASSSMLDGIVGFKSSYQAIKTDQSPVRLPNAHYLKEAVLVSDYRNLRSQCVFTLADMVNKHLIASKMEGQMKDQIIEELSVYQDVSKTEGKRMATMKEDVKELIGRSPDASDCWLQRMYFVIKSKMLPQDSPEGESIVQKQRERFIINRANLINETNK